MSKLDVRVSYFYSLQHVPTSSIHFSARKRKIRGGLLFIKDGVIHGARELVGVHLAQDRADRYFSTSQEEKTENVS